MADAALPANLLRAFGDVYRQIPKPTLFGSQLFTAMNPTYADVINLTVMKYGRLAAVDIIPGTHGANTGKNTVQNIKEYKPPMYDQDVVVTAAQLAKVAPGLTNDFNVQPAMVVRIAQEVSEALLLCKSDIQRAIELQAWQVLLHDTITLINGDNLTFGRHADNTVTAGVAWTNANATIERDVNQACNAVTKHGAVNPDTLILDDAGFIAMMENEKFQKKFDLKFVNDVNKISPVDDYENSGAVYQGYARFGSFKLNIFTYPQFYEDATGLHSYLPKDRAIVVSSKARREKHFAYMPTIGNGDQSASNVTGIMNSSVPIDFKPYAFLDKRGDNLEVGMKSRPLCIPVAVDGSAVIDTKVA